MPALRHTSPMAVPSSACRKTNAICALSAGQCYGPGPGGGRGADAAAPAPHAFMPDEKAVVRKFLDADFLRDEGFRIDDGLGLLSDDTGRTILPPAFVRALRKIVGFAPAAGSEPRSLAAASGAPRPGLLGHASSAESQYRKSIQVACKSSLDACRLAYSSIW